MKNTIGAIVAVIAIGAIGFVIFSGSSDAPAANNQNSQSSNSTQQSPAAPSSNTQQAAASEFDPNNYTKGAQIGDTLDATDQTEVAVNIDDFIFNTTYLKVKKGTTVTWTNQGRVRHDVTSATDSPQGGLGSDLLKNGESYSYTFDEVGLYEYFCSPHPTQMRATVLVVE